MQNKIYSRQVLTQTSHSSKFLILEKVADLDNVYEGMKELLPFIIKFPESAGSKDVLKNKWLQWVYKGVKQLIKKYPDIPVMAEEYLDGPQYLVETIVYKNAIHIIAVFQQEITFEKRFIVTGYNLLLNSSVEFIDHLERSVRSIINAFGMETGPCHLEFL